MDSSPIALIAVMILALAFDFSNGLNDAANVIATVVGARVLSPTKAMIMSAKYLQPHLQCTFSTFDR